MMKFLLIMLFIMFIFNYIEWILIQMIYQNLIFFLFTMFLIMYPLNSLGWVNLYYYMGFDIYSMGLILLSLWIISLMVLVSLDMLMMMTYKYYLIIINFLLMFLFLCFSSINMFLFYLFFECSLVPVFLLILGWGGLIDRIQASLYMMIYTLVGSMPLFISIIWIYKYTYSLNMLYVNIFMLNMYLYLSLILAFLIKMPMYMVHLWLPKAHVEAPLTGSMILAGVMLKLGSYGLMRFMLIMIKMCISYNKIIMIFSLMGGIYSSLICLCQVDMKMLVAYSSVVHMSVLLSGVMTLFNFGYLGGMLMMMAHGLCSSGLFCLVNINYERLSSRSLMLNKGMINFFPSLSLMWFLLCSSNLSFPPSLNLWSELMLINSLIYWDMNMIFLLIFILFFSASYSLYLYSYSQHGILSNMNMMFKGIKINEFILLLLHWIPLNIMFVVMYLFIY